MNRLLRRSIRAQQAAIFRLSIEMGLDQVEAAIPPEMTFLEWVERLAANGLKVDGKPFSFENRKALRAVYAAIPSTKEEAYNRAMAVMKGAQTGLTVMLFLVQLYFALKFAPTKIGTYYPDRTLAAYVSDSRFMPVVRTVPVALEALKASSAGDEGNKMNRKFGSSEVLFLWTSGAASTESFPLDVELADEVQQMSDKDIERIRERMSASDIRFFLAVSTAMWPGADIDLLFKRGDQRSFHSRCRCDDGVVLDAVFPKCIEFNAGEWPDAPRDYIYICPTCRTWISDPQDGEWKAHNPSAKEVSFHFPQTLSPTVSPREVITDFETATDLQNFYNRKMGVPWTDPQQVPITLAILQQCAQAGAAAGVTWKTHAKGAYMGIDQMGQYNVVVIKERLKDGRQAVIHVEAIYAADPFERCDQLMEAYGIAVCAVEANPNYNPAHAFAKRHPGRVFVANYSGSMPEEILRWGDAPRSRSERRTSEDVQERHTVLLNQFKCMSVSAGRITRLACLFPDPDGLQQDVLVKGRMKRVSILREEVWLHLTKFALVAEEDKEQRKWKRKVAKIGIDPHFAYANMLCDVAWAREHGTGTIYLPGVSDAATDAPDAAAVQQAMPGLPAQVAQMIAPPTSPGTCGACSSFAEGRCTARGFTVRQADPACIIFTAKSS